MPPKKTAKQEGDIDSMTVVELKEALKAKGLEVTGRKAELVARLKGEDSSTPTPSSKKRPNYDEDYEQREEKAARGSKKAKKQEVEEDEDEDEAVDEKPTRASGRVKEKQAAADAKESSVGNWQNEGSVYFLTSSALTHSSEIASFDMDDTLIETQSGKTFAEGRHDWQWLYPEIPDKLKQLNARGVKVVIFTNQGGIDGKNGFDSAKLKAIEGKIEDLCADLGFPMQAFIATTEDEFRKPSTAMWDLMAKKHNGGIVPDLERSIFVGDAAGRAAGWAPGRKKDFSCSDRKFAHNIGIKFSTPEEYFKNEASAAFDWGTFDLTSIPSHASGAEITHGGVKTLTAPHQEMVLFVGFPASGKSTLAKTYMVPAGYEHINRDTLKTQDKCLKAARQAVSAGKSVVIDNTNPDASTRATYIQVAQDASIPVRCFKFEVEELLANHLNYFRERIGISDHVPRIGYAMYKKKYEEPKLSEGFSEIKKIQFVAKFTNPDHEKVFKQLA